MDKVLISLYVPAISELYDVYLPLYLPIKDIVELLRKGVKQISVNKYYSSNTEVLCHIQKGNILLEKKTLSEYHVKNGDKLMFC